MQTPLQILVAARVLFISLFCLILVVSCQRGNESRYYSLEDFSKVPKVDVHVHVNTSDPALLEQAEEDNFFLLTINVDVPDYPSITQQQAHAVSLRSQFPKRLNFLSTFGTQDILEEDWQQRALEALEVAQENGSVGVKVWKNIGMVIKNNKDQFVQINDPMFEGVFEYLAQHNIPVCGHIGEPRNCWLPLEQMTVNNDRNYYARHPEYHMYQ